MSERILENLNASQKAAVSSAASTVAILAGPGSGKTHTLTSRTAWLLKHEGYQPWNVIVATFTVKASREMKERIGKLIGDGMESKLILGTFHSIARRYLARYGHLINIKKDFGIADSGDSLAIIKRIVKRHRMTIDPAAARSRISSRKAKGAQWEAAKAVKSVELQEFDTCYDEYEEALKRSNLLDYDDLLLRCVDLLRDHPSCVSNVEAVLIDEFQDTNLVQFDLMRLFAAQRKRVTIVGDPDQSIYGFRAAETKNFKRMLRQYPDTVTIPLEENYRSSGAILLAALEVIRQDESRIDKSLLATHTVGTQPVLRKLPSAHIEAQWIVGEISRCLVLTGNLMDYNDVSILLRSASLSRILESALGKAGIPYRMVGGQRFFDRVEVKLLLDYLRIINQPDNNDAVARVINLPSRRIGDTTIKALLEEADRAKKTLWTLILDIAQGNITSKTKLAKQTEQGVEAFVNIILTARKKVSEGLQSPVDMIDYIVKKIGFEEWLEKTYPEEHEGRLANVQELIALAAEFTSQIMDGHDEDVLPTIDGLEQEELSQPLSKFLANVALASDIKAAEEESAPKAQVTISTIHAAKGLEWPIVFIPAAYQGSIPHSRADDDDEERRLLYVAMTRAKALLYLSYPLKDSQQGQTTISPFLAPKSLKRYFSAKGPSFLSAVTQTMANILRRSCPTEYDREAIANLENTEDDRYGGDEEEDMEHSGRNYEEWDGHHYSRGQQAVKRRRIETNVAEKSNTEPWKPLYSTTVAQASSFTTATIPRSGFMSAGSHLQTLNQQSVNCIADTRVTTPSHSKNRQTAEEDGDHGASKVSMGKTTKRSAGQSSISAFLKPPVGSAGAPVHRDYVTASRAPRKQISQAQHPIPSARVAMTSKPAEVGILPSLAAHKLGSASLPRPLATKCWQQDDESMRSKKAYLQFSSSPQALDSTIRDAELDRVEELDLTKAMTTAVNMEPTPLQKVSRPASSFHVTTVKALNTLNDPPPPRRTLGVRRTMNGWNDRMRKG